ncbi:hypothetical protein BDZ89DRAFT_1163823 [Hymenopellis radicata]|nr:hypothetical protein BDZ89DRAFT_1163823 [Hymenopellis radicata]
MGDYTAIDDRDSAVVRTGSWVDGGTEHEHDSTVSSSKNEGDYLTVTFTGTEIIVYGTYDYSSLGVITSYAIDDGTATQVNHTSSGGDTYQQEFWKSGTLNLTEHKLVLTMVHVNTEFEDVEGTVWIDYFNVVDAPATQTISSTASSSASSTSITFDSGSSSPPVGAIIGAVVGVIAILSLGVGLFLWYRSRRRRIRGLNPPPAPPYPQFPGTSGTTPLLPGTVEPYMTQSNGGVSYFPVAPTGTAFSQYSQSLGDVNGTSSTSKRGSLSSSITPVGAATAPAPSSSGTGSQRNSLSVAEMKQRQGEAVAAARNIEHELPVVQHTDSGIRTGQTLELPPMYTAD